MATETEIEAMAREVRQMIDVIAARACRSSFETLIDQLEDAALDRVRADDTRDALRYLIERVDREFKDQDQPPELDFVLMAANEVRHLAGFSGGASAALDRVRADDTRDALAELVRLKDHPEHDTLSPIVKREAWQRAREALASGRTPPNDK